MSKYSEYIKSRKKNDMDFFFGKENWKMVSNKYFNYNPVIDEDNIIVWTNPRLIKLWSKKGEDNNYSAIMPINKNQAIFVKDFCLREVEYWDADEQQMYVTMLVKLNRKYFKPYTFKDEFYMYENANTFDDFVEIAKRQAEHNFSFKNVKLEDEIILG